MRLVRAAQLLGLFVLAMAPASGAMASRVTLTSGASRNCTGEMRVRMVSQLGQPVADEQLQSEALNETLSVRMTGGHYEMRHNTTDREGQTLLIAHVRPDGTVVDATVSGRLATMTGGGDQLQRLAVLAARLLPERLLLGREVRPGDNLYVDADMQDVLAGLTGAIGLPADFQFEATGGMPFTGTTGDDAGRILNFTGPIRAQGGGAIGGQTMSFEFSGHATTRIDASTGLLRGSAMDGNMDLRVNGASQLVMHMRQSMTCIITSGTT